VRFSVPATSDVSVKIYNMLGQEVRNLFTGTMDRGTKSIEWYGRDNLGRSMSTGTYIYRMVAGSFVESKKMVLVK
jgi:flagellar hook assembly protein FlgD